MPKFDLMRDLAPIASFYRGLASWSIYGMGRFPVTLYKQQWLPLLDISSDIREFIAANEAQLKTKE